MLSYKGGKHFCFAYLPRVGLATFREPIRFLYAVFRQANFCVYIFVNFSRSPKIDSGVSLTPFSKLDELFVAHPFVECARASSILGLWRVKEH